MTCIIDPRCRTKKELKLQADALNDPAKRVDYLFILRDPALFNPKEEGQHFTLSNVYEGEEIVVTNHPRRSWFAQVGRKNGRLYVK